MQKIIALYHDKDINKLKLGCTLPNVANICLHKCNFAKFYPFTEGEKDFWKKIEKLFLVVHLPFLHAKQLMMKLLFESLQIYANLLLGLMPANCIPTRCVNPCLPVFARVTISVPKQIDSPIDKTRHASLKLWSCPISNEQDQNVKLKASLQQADRRKMTASVLMGFVLIATLCLRPRVAFTTSVTVQG